MSDDLRIPAMGFGPGAHAPDSSSYRARAPVSASYRARRPGAEPGTRYAAIGAAGLGALLLVGVGTWAAIGRRPGVVPVIEADSRPIRIKPENPGGMQFAGSDEVAGDGAPGTERMAPPAETPAPQALRAQLQPPAAPAATAPDPAPGAAPPVAPATQAPPAGSPLPDTPARPGVGAKAGSPLPARLAAPPTAATPPTGGTIVQLGALPSEAAAQAEWKRLAKAAPDLVDHHQPALQKIERDGKTFWRLRTSGFTDIADATTFCTRLRAKGGNCTIASF